MTPLAAAGVDLAITPEISDDIIMGIFGPNGVHEVAQDIVEELNGVPVQRTGKLVVYIVRVIIKLSALITLLYYCLCILYFKDVFLTRFLFC